MLQYIMQQDATPDWCVSASFFSCSASGDMWFLGALMSSMYQIPPRQ